jgi:hypothetical protein
MPLKKDPDVAPQPGSRQGALIGLQAFFIVVALCVYGLRVYTRRIILRSLGNDDYIMGVAVVSLLSVITLRSRNVHAISSLSDIIFLSPLLTSISLQPNNTTAVFPLETLPLHSHYISNISLTSSFITPDYLSSFHDFR